jgi:hypothetical protein
MITAGGILKWFQASGLHQADMMNTDAELRKGAELLRLFPRDEADLLFATVGEVRVSNTVELEGALARVDPESGEVVGIEILFFSRKFGIPPSAATREFVWNLIDAAGPAVQRELSEPDHETEYTR